MPTAVRRIDCTAVIASFDHRRRRLCTEMDHGGLYIHWSQLYFSAKTATN